MAVMVKAYNSAGGGRGTVAVKDVEEMDSN